MKTSMSVWDLKFQERGIQAVALDYGGVIADMISEENLAHLAAIAEVPVESFRTPYWAHRASYDSGEYDFKQYMSTVLTLCNSPCTEKLDYENYFLLDTLAYASLRLKMVHWIHTLRSQGIPVILISNMSREVGRHLIYSSTLAGQFTHTVLSGEIGINKPDNRIYTHALSRISLPPERVLFIDDRLDNARGAKESGMQSAQMEVSEQIMLL